MNSSAMNLVIGNSTTEDGIVVKTDPITNGKGETVNLKDTAIIWLLDNMGTLDKIIEDYNTNHINEDLVKYVELSTPRVDHMWIILDKGCEDFERDAIEGFINALPLSRILDRLKFIYPNSASKSILQANGLNPLLIEFDHYNSYYNKGVTRDWLDEECNKCGVYKLTFDEYQTYIGKDIDLLYEYIRYMNFWERRTFKEEIKAIHMVKDAYIKLFPIQK